MINHIRQVINDLNGSKTIEYQQKIQTWSTDCVNSIVCQNLPP